MLGILEALILALEVDCRRLPSWFPYGRTHPVDESARVWWSSTTDPPGLGGSVEIWDGWFEFGRVKKNSLTTWQMASGLCKCPLDQSRSKTRCPHFFLQDRSTRRTFEVDGRLDFSVRIDVFFVLSYRQSPYPWIKSMNNIPQKNRKPKYNSLTLFNNTPYFWCIL